MTVSNDSTRRKRWEVWVTDEERARVTAAAGAARLSIGPCLARLAQGTPIVRRDDWRRGVTHLDHAATLLEELADRVRTLSDPLDALYLGARMVALERAFDTLARPWSGPTEADESGTGVQPDTADAANVQGRSSC